MPIGAVQTASGYEVAWKEAGADEYTFWNVDSNGNFLSNTIGVVSGTSSALESQEPIFNQDLNGDGMIGLATTSASSLQYNGDTLTAAYGATLLVEDRAIINAGNILIEGTLAIAVATLTLAGDGAVTLAGGTIGGSAAGEVPVNAGNTLSGFGTIGDGTSHLALENASGTIEANGATLVLDTEITITTGGALAAAAGATLQIDDSVTGAGPVTIGSGATLELAATDSASVTFAGLTGMLKLDRPSTFSGEIFNFTGNGGLSGSDQIDLKSINYNSVHDT